jgi:hypothetical protein
MCVGKVFLKESEAGRVNHNTRYLSKYSSRREGNEKEMEFVACE